MVVHRYTIVVAVAILFTLGACLQPPEYPIEPVLTFQGLSRDSMIQGAGQEDNISVFMSFTDGDGDIAPRATDTVPNIFLINTKTLEQVTTFKLDPIPEEGAENGISGEIRLRVFTTCCDYPDFVTAFPCTPTNEYPVDTLNIEAYMVDRAGNESNRVQFSPIYLICNR